MRLGGCNSSRLVVLVILRDIPDAIFLVRLLNSGTIGDATLYFINSGGIQNLCVSFAETLLQKCSALDHSDRARRREREREKTENLLNNVI